VEEQLQSALYFGSENKEVKLHLSTKEMVPWSPGHLTTGSCALKERGTEGSTLVGAWLGATVPPRF